MSARARTERSAARAVLRAAGAALLALLALELLLPFACGEALDEGDERTRSTRAFHRALFAPDRATLERLRPSAFLAQQESAAGSQRAPGPERVGIEIRTNSHGLRMREVALAPPRDATRIAVLGDSVSFGWRVREFESWPRVLEGALRRAGRAAEVLNFGVPGHTTAQAVAELRARVLGFRPRIVVLATGFNDHWLRPGESDRARLERSAQSSALAHALYSLRRESAIARGLRRLVGAPEPGLAPAGAPLERRVPRSELDAALEEAHALCRASGAALVVADLCFPHARTADGLRAFAERTGTALFDGRACLGIAPAPATPLATPRRLRVALEPGLRARWEAGGDELVALAFPPDRVRALADLELRPLARDGAQATLALESGAPRDWACVPRSYLDAAGASLERLMTLVYHRVPDGPPEGELPMGRFLGAAYDAADAPHAAYAHGEAIHPNAAGHARLGEHAARFLRDHAELGAALEEHGER